MKSHLNLKHILDRKSFPLFLKALNNKVDLKEWSEVGGVFASARKILQKYQPEYIFDIGCGKRPTLAMMMALNYGAEVEAIDPQLDLTCGEGVDRYVGRKEKLKEFLSSCGPAYFPEKPILVLANHSHVSKREIMGLLASYNNWVYVTVPCCIDNRLSNTSAITYKDIHMHSDKNDVYVYASDSNFIKHLL